MQYEENWISLNAIDVRFILRCTGASLLVYTSICIWMGAIQEHALCIESGK